MTDLPPVSTPLPAGKSKTEGVVKYFAMLARSFWSVTESSHMIRKKAIIAVTKSA
jgi:hypothetical protein